MYLEALVAKLIEPVNLHHATSACQWACLLEIALALQSVHIASNRHNNGDFLRFRKNDSFSNFIR
jgi:hypothetical protein